MPALADLDGDLIPDVLQSLKRVRLSEKGLGGGTDYSAGLSMARDIFGAAGTSPEQANIIFLSDGEATSDSKELADELRALGVNIRAIGVGRDSSLSNLRRMDPEAIQVTSSDELLAAFEPDERLLENVLVYADYDADGSPGVDEPSTTTLSDNVFTSVLESGDYRIRLLKSESYPIRATLPGFEQISDPVAHVRSVVPTVHLLALQRNQLVDPPSIVLQPVGGEWRVGQTVRLSLLAVGEGLHFQWMKNGVGLPGETSSSLTFSSVNLEDAGEYSVRVTSDGGSIQSELARLIVIPALDPVAIVGPPIGGNLFEGDSLTLFVLATGGGTLSYQWRKDGTEIPMATEHQLLLSEVGLEDAGDYDVIVSNPVGSVISHPASVIVASVTDPILPPSVLLPILHWNRETGGLELQGIPGANYIIEATSDLVDGVWVPVATVVLLTNEITWEDPVAGLIPVRFYRARLLPN